MDRAGAHRRYAPTRTFRALALARAGGNVTAKIPAVAGGNRCEETVDPYRVLFVHPSAPQPVIRAAYYALARLYHPDRAAIPGADRLMAELNLAYAQVSTPEVRATLAREHNREGSQPTVAPPWRPTTHAAGLQETIRRRSTAAPDASGAVPRGMAGDRLQPATMDYGRYQGWRLDEIARTDRGYLEWLGRSPAGRRFKMEIDRVLAGLTG